MGSPVVGVASGLLRGRWDSGVASFLGVPYAESPIGERRFSPPEPATAWDGVRNATHFGAAAPQSASRSELVMGPMQVPGYDEDCLTINVWTPDPSTGADLPVLVWLHGGGFLFGAGCARWYDGSTMAERGPMVVVTLNYRLGALGYLYLPGTFGEPSTANLGLQDQCLALEWVKQNIASFGGNPDCVTVAGQSAGGISVVGLHAAPRARGLFNRAIVWSSGLQLPANTPEAALRATDLFLAAAGVGRTPESLRDLSVDRILHAQEATLVQCAIESGGDPRLRPRSMVPFQLVVDGAVLPVDPVEAARTGAMDQPDLLIGVNANEMGFVFAADDAFWERSSESIRTDVLATWGDAGTAVFEIYAHGYPEKSAPEVLCTMLSHEGAVPSIELAELRASAGRPAYFAWFTWGSSAFDGRLGATHTAELPFVFNNFEQWRESPLVAGVDQQEFNGLAEQVQNAWISFCATGVPGSWPNYQIPERAAMEYGESVQTIHDPAPLRSATGLTFGEPVKAPTPKGSTTT